MNRRKISSYRGLRVQGIGFRVYGSCCMEAYSLGSGFSGPGRTHQDWLVAVQGSGVRVWGSGCGKRASLDAAKTQRVGNVHLVLMLALSAIKTVP